MNKTNLLLLFTVNQLLLEFTHFDRFLSSTYKVGMIHTLLCKCFRSCSDWMTKFQFEFVKLMNVFISHSYPENFINNCFKVFLNSKYWIQEKVATLANTLLFLVLPYLGPLSLQTRTKWRKSLKYAFNFWKIQIVFKSQNKFANAFCFKVCIPKELTFGVVYKSQCRLCNECYYGEYVRYPHVSI